jgi:hypothetical protein
MSQEANSDIRNLFLKFGGESSNYQEIQQTYVTEKAEHSWPIVEAMERSRPAVPTRKAVSKLAPVADIVQPVAPVVQPVAPTVQSVVQPVPAPGGLSSLFARQDVPPAASHATVPLRTLFGSFGASPQVQPQALPVAPASDNSLNAVFSRLLNPQQPVAPVVQESNLRGLFGFLNK